MGSAKRELDALEEKRQYAIQIAVESGVLQVCEHHDDILLDGGNDLEDAYKLGCTMFDSGDLSTAFESKSELTSLIEDVFTENADDECHSCARWGED